MRSDDEILSFFNENISEMEASYFEHYGNRWEAGKAISYKPILNGGNSKEGILVLFRNGYLGIREDGELECEKTEGEPYGWPKTDRYFREGGDLGIFEDDDSYRWKAMCIEQDNRICQVCALTDLLLTYKYSLG